MRETLDAAGREREGEAEEAGVEAGMYGSVLQPVPVVIIGSHYDQIPADSREEVVVGRGGAVSGLTVFVSAYTHSRQREGTFPLL